MSRNKIVALVSFILGIILLIYTWQPLAYWYFFVKPALTKNSVVFLSPLAQFPSTQILPKTEGRGAYLNFENQNNPQNLANQFFLTIEKFEIAKAKVVTGDNFLTQLAHLPGTSEPGGIGNVVISGHASLPQLFSPQSYWSIFSKLYLLEAGDVIILEDDNKSFTYQVTEMLVVKPVDTWVVSSPDQFGSYLTLLTCGVGGLTQDRIIIRATLVNSQKLI